jgi:uncharacterized membrane protein
MGSAKASAVIDAPPSDVFAYVDDWRNVQGFTQDLTVWEPVGDVTQGIGARFHAAMRTGPMTQESTLEITRWEKDAAIGWEPLSGLKQSGLYTFVAAEGGTQVTLQIDLQLPGGIAGRLLGKTVEPALRANVAKTLENLKQVFAQRP